MREKIPRFIEEFQTDDKTVKHTKYCKALRFVYKGGNCTSEKQNIVLLKNLLFNRIIYKEAKGADAGEMKFHLLAT